MWGLSADAPDDFWSVYFLAAPVEVVNEVVRKEARVYITHINTPTEVVIAGDSQACERIVADLGVEHLRASFSTVIHCDITFSEYERFYDINHLPVHNKPEVCFYSAADYAPIPLDAEVIAHSLSRSVCKTLDFPRLVNRVYDDGARIFIELGPRSTCTRWISETLGSREHVSVSANQLGMDDHTALLRMLAPLVSHGVPMDIAALFNSENYQAQAAFAVPGEAIYPYAQAATQAHRTFLERRLESLLQMGEMLRLQTELYAQQPVLAAPVPLAPQRPALFDENALQEFATGSIAACFGPEYAIYENRRAPRIPNGDLLLVSRIIDLEAERYKLEPGARAVSEYDMTAHPWFYRDNAYPTIPYSVYMEMALQLCGFLSAYLGSSLSFPNLDFYFRNLDGQGTLYSDSDLSGKTITNTVQMLSSITLEGIILQKFSFQLEGEGEVIYAGEASFGFFTDRAMQNQTGLDKGKPTLPWYRQQNLTLAPVPIPANYYQPQPGKPHYRLAQGQLDFVDTLLLMPDGGQHGQGYIYASKKLDPTDWFFYCHFYQDPVMPGSLGVEAILQAMQAFALELDLGKSFRSPCFKQATPHTVIWHYRGQVSRLHSAMMLEIHVKRIEHTPEQVTIIGDASLWRDDGLRIYEVLDVALGIQEAL
jgi:3-hydroxymyristoyl/3-hydroxydecanoyl-(acyl carrier protein) dehydratase